MLTHPTEQRLIDLGLAGMAKALEEQRRLPDVAALSFEERLGLLVEAAISTATIPISRGVLQQSCQHCFARTWETSLSRDQRC